MGLLKEFKDFIVKGNALDLAVGLIIGVAFGAVVTSLVQDILMPPLGALMADLDFSKIAYVLKEKTADKDAVVIGFGKFINALISLVIQGFAVFMIVKAINSVKRREQAVPAPATPPADVQLLTEIRDLLKNR
jgi:large conductance mechanosensitive channel